MDWKGVKFFDHKGVPLDSEGRALMLKALERGLSNPDVDPETLIAAVSKVCTRMNGLRDVWAYATRVMFREGRRASIKERKVIKRFDELKQNSPISARWREGGMDHVEQQVLINELLEQLGGLDREIFGQRLQGFSFGEIDKNLSLRNRTSEYRYREAMERLAKRFSFDTHDEVGDEL